MIDVENVLSVKREQLYLIQEVIEHYQNDSSKDFFKWMCNTETEIIEEIKKIENGERR